MDAIKCPDCSTWWRGDEHRCDEPDWFVKVIEEIHRMGDRMPYVAPVVMPCSRPHADHPWSPWWTGTGTTTPIPWPGTTITYLSSGSNT